MNCCFCRDAAVQRSSHGGLGNSTLLMLTSEQIKKIETQYNKYVSGELDCTPQEGATIVNNYNSRRKIERLI
tara:strand:- start:153 stop:368 length:216 start_codon:yes stop_codon:yes gene_type:complete